MTTTQFLLEKAIKQFELDKDGEEAKQLHEYAMQQLEKKYGEEMVGRSLIQISNTIESFNPRNDKDAREKALIKQITKFQKKAEEESGLSEKEFQKYYQMSDDGYLEATKELEKLGDNSDKAQKVEIYYRNFKQAQSYQRQLDQLYFDDDSEKGSLERQKRMKDRENDMENSKLYTIRIQTSFDDNWFQRKYKSGTINKILFSIGNISRKATDAYWDDTPRSNGMRQKGQMNGEDQMLPADRKKLARLQWTITTQIAKDYLTLFAGEKVANTILKNRGFLGRMKQVLFGGNEEANSIVVNYSIQNMPTETEVEEKPQGATSSESSMRKCFTFYGTSGERFHYPVINESTIVTLLEHKRTLTESSLKEKIKTLIYLRLSNEKM